MKLERTGIGDTVAMRDQAVEALEGGSGRVAETEEEGWLVTSIIHVCFTMSVYFIFYVCVCVCCFHRRDRVRSNRVSRSPYRWKHDLFETMNEEEKEEGNQSRCVCVCVLHCSLNSI